MIVSIYKNVIETTGYKADIFYLLTTDKWRNLSDKVRAEPDKDKRDKLKKKLLPAFTPSGIFKDNERNDRGLIKHSGYMCIDIDEDDNPHINDWQNVITQLSKLPEVAFAGLSVSGRGVFLIIPIKYTDRHKEHFNAFQRSFKKRGLIIDPKCGNLSRLRFYSYNKDYYLNKEAVPYRPLYDSKAIREPQPSSSMSAVSFTSNKDDVEALVREIAIKGINIVPDYDSWFKVGAALSNVPNGRELFHTISRIDSNKYNYKECDKKFDNIKPGGGITINTLFHIAKKSGVTLKRKNTSNSFSEYSKPKKVTSKSTQQKVEEPKLTDKKMVGYVDKDGKLYIPNPNGDDTLSVYSSVEHYNLRKVLPTIIESDKVDTSRMDKLYINLTTLRIHLPHPPSTTVDLTGGS